MNDFTKEELYDIAEMMRHARKQGIDTKYNLTYHIEDKVWHMIENYCEHEKVVPNYDCKTQCDKCGKIL